MKFIKRFMDKVSGSRRRRYGGGGSSSYLDQDNRNGKRRTLKENGTNCTEQESVVSLNSMSGDASVGAPWRADRIAVTGPPCADDWWDSVSIGSGANDGNDDDDKVAIEVTASGSSKKFHNCGLETWEKARAVWRQPNDKREELISESIAKSTGSSPKKEGKELLKGLTRARSLRSYELPRRTNLKDLVETYNTIWSGMDD